MKIVVNRCFGGFGLSEKAMVELYRAGSKMIKAHAPENYYGGRIGWEQRFEKDCKSEGFGPLVVDGKILTAETHDKEHRCDPKLVEVVERLGKESWGSFAELEVVDIPDDVEWEIDEYDGQESVEEAHRRW